jgi:hypothetical protein
VNALKAIRGKKTTCIFRLGSNNHIIRSEEIIGIFEVSKKYDLVRKDLPAPGTGRWKCGM